MGVPSRFIGEMKLDEVKAKEEPAREAQGLACGGGGTCGAGAGRRQAG